MDDSSSNSSNRQSMSTSSQTPLTKTCQHCATAKVKCIRAGDAQICNRCSRLGKECFYRQARRRFYGNKNDNRIEQLEARVNELLDRQSVSSEARRLSESSPAASDVGHSSVSPQASVTHTNAWARDFGLGSATPEPSDDLVENGLLTLEKADALLIHFRTVMVYHFPFVIPPPHQNADELRRSQPFLFMAIMASASYREMPLQRLLGRILNRKIMNHVISTREVSFDFLQALLVFIAWSQYHPRPRRHSQLLAIAVSVLIDLRLDRPPETWTWQNGITFHPDYFGEKHTSPQSAKKDRQRAVIGCYYMASTSSVLMRKLNSFPFSSQIQKYSENLCLEPEYPTDKYLFYIVTLQKIWEKIDVLPVRLDSNLEDEGSPIRMHIKMLQNELDLWHATLPFPISEAQLLERQHQTVQLFMSQIGLLARIHPAKNSRLPSSPWYSELLSTGLVTANTFFRNYLAAPVDSERIYNNSEVTAVGLFLIVGPKLMVTATEQSVSPEILAILQDLDMETTLDGMIGRINSLVTDEVDFEGDRNVFFQFSKRIQGVKDWFSRRPLVQRQTYHQQQHPSSDPGIQTQDLPILSLTGPPVQVDHYLGSTPHYVQGPVIPNAEMDQMMADWFSFPMQTF